MSNFDLFSSMFSELEHHLNAIKMTTLSIVAIITVACIALIFMLLRQNKISKLSSQLNNTLEKTENNLRIENSNSLAKLQDTLLAQNANSLANLQQTLLAQTAESERTHNAHINTQIDTLTKNLSSLQATLNDTLNAQLQNMSETSARRFVELQNSNNAQLSKLQDSNERKLDEMRQTVDEKLQKTLQARLNESFTQVSERMDQVLKGLGEMNVMAQNVGSLKNLLQNISVRGTFGEVQLGSLLEQMLTPDQYCAQVNIGSERNSRVDFAILLPGKNKNSDNILLPIDSKFPTAAYESLQQAQQDANKIAVKKATNELAKTLTEQAKSISQKYINPPQTTDYAFLFLPSESLYAEAMRIAGLMVDLQNKYHVVIAGPSTLLAMLNTLQMGFNAIILEKRSSEIQKILEAVKTEFSKFGGFLEGVKKSAQEMLNKLDKTSTRTNQMQRALKNINMASEEDATKILAYTSLDQDLMLIDEE